MSKVRDRIRKMCKPLPKSGRDIKIIVTLTTFPARIRIVGETLLSLFNQTLPPDRIVLWLAEEQFPKRERSLPKEILEFRRYGLEIRWCADLKAHKKYFYALQTFPNDILITVDDDVIYDKELVEELYSSYQKFPHAVSARRAHKILFDEAGEPLPYDRWIKEYPSEIFVPRFDLIATGAGGILYPPGCLSEITTDDDAIRQTCLFGDDLWLKAMQMLQGTPLVPVSVPSPLRIVQGSQDVALWRTNVDNNENDTQLSAILQLLKEKYGCTDIFRRAIDEDAYLYTGEIPKVSVVVPVYNVSQYLRDALDSLIDQTLRNIEIICVNDGSTDDSLQILNEYCAKDSRIVIINKSNSGYGDTMNRGIERARGEYIGILEPDDFVSSDMFVTLYCVAKEKNLDLVKGDIIQFYGDGEARTTKYITVANKDRSYYHRVINVQEDFTPLYFTMNTWAGIYNREFLNRHGIRHNTTPGASYQDSGFWFQTFFWSQRIYFLNRPFYRYRQDNPNSSINNPNKVYCVCDEYNFIAQIMDRYPKKKAYFLDIYVYRKYFSYKFALSKMGEKYKYAFLCRFSEEFRRHEQASEINWMLFTLKESNDLRAIIDNPALYFVEHYPNAKTIGYEDVELQLARLTKSIREYQCNAKKKKARKKRHNLYDYARLLGKVYNSLQDSGVLETLKKVERKTKKYLFGNKEASISQTRKKVMFVASDNSPSSGAFLSMTALAQQLRDRYNVEPLIILPCEGKGQMLLAEKELRYMTIPSHNWVVLQSDPRDIAMRVKILLEKRENRRAIRRIEELIERENVALVHINTTYSYVAAVAAHRKKVPVVWHLREFLEEDQEKTLWNRKKGNRLIGRSDKVIAISDSLYQKYRPVIPSDRLVRIYNGINTDVFYQPEKEIFVNARPIFLFVGGFAVYKGHIEFAEAMIELARRGISDFEIWFVGTGNPRVRERVEKLFLLNGLQDRYKIFGYRKDVEKFLQQADIAFCCSRAEAFGRVTVEAMLSGVLTIGADIAGTAELIRNGETGLLYESGNPNSLADCVEYALSHQNEMRIVADNGRRDMVTYMTANRNADDIYQLYEEIWQKDKK